MSNLSIEVQIGGGQHCAVVDEFLEGPHALISKATEHADKFVTRPLGHPGRGPDVGDAEMEDIKSFIRLRLSRLFPFYRAGISLTAFLSNVNLNPEELSTFHRLCHVDPRRSPIHRTFAGIVYLLGNPELGGTAFYRWKARHVAEQAYRLASSDEDAALRYLKEHSEVFRRAPEYMTRSNDIAELLAVIPARFNRLVFYNGEMPHSGQITHPDLLTSDPARGRLSPNFFVNVRPREAVDLSA